MASMIGGIVSLTIGIVIFSNVLMTTLKNTNTSTWEASEIALWGVVGLIGIIGIVVGVMNVFGIQ